MTNTNHGSGNDPVPAEIDAAWAAFEVALASYLATMTDPDEGDHLLIEVTDPDPDGGAGCPPYAQFAAWSALSLVQEDRPLVVTRTFSKTWSMAGVRLG